MAVYTSNSKELISALAAEGVKLSRNTVLHHLAHYLATHAYSGITNEALESRLGLARRTIQTALQWLDERGWIVLSFSRTGMKSKRRIMAGPKFKALLKRLEAECYARLEAENKQALENQAKANKSRGVKSTPLNKVPSEQDNLNNTCNAPARMDNPSVEQVEPGVHTVQTVNYFGFDLRNHLGSADVIRIVDTLLTRVVNACPYDTDTHKHYLAQNFVNAVELECTRDDRDPDFLGCRTAGDFADYLVDHFEACISEGYRDPAYGWTLNAYLRDGNYTKQPEQEMHFLDMQRARQYQQYRAAVYTRQYSKELNDALLGCNF